MRSEIVSFHAIEYHVCHMLYKHYAPLLRLRLSFWRVGLLLPPRYPSFNHPPIGGWEPGFEGANSRRRDSQFLQHRLRLLTKRISPISLFNEKETHAMPIEDRGRSFFTNIPRTSGPLPPPFGPVWRNTRRGLTYSRTGHWTSLRLENWALGRV